MADEAGKTLTEQQRKWFASITASMQEETGKTLDEWVEIARTSPETTHHKRVKWFKAEHGLGQNRASIVLMKAFPENAMGAQPDAARAAIAPRRKSNAWKPEGAPVRCRRCMPTRPTTASPAPPWRCACARKARAGCRR